ncbi:uracil-DNA glycosylase family protein [Marinomonas sp. 15G1-11]|uniref:Uracil-DNA glycosylase family protein n=1 Tax=Marinomonas phaeophyticola TaxID=3004091 RepID=A0ABT4JTR0_9GAMM|nr:uracil-DNA glycosylase family protein [Marinomonas sp. 15G1-11]MCZ2721605.1 uracil-DNA glycosylase family protein [Marinomonas sp. 15G1-11]
MERITILKKDIQNCTLCSESLPFGPRPVIQVAADSRILIVGQAPGRRVHESGIPFDDPSGDRLRDWMGVSKEVFYDASQIALVPMGFCYPGTGKSGDLAPRKECVAAWRAELLSALTKVELTLVLGQYAMKYHLPNTKRTLTDTVFSWKAFYPDVIPLPHPSPRNNIWLKRHPWFESELLPALKLAVRSVLDS